MTRTDSSLQLRSEVHVEKRTVSLSVVMTTCYLHISVLTSKASQDSEITITILS
jgi:hypothetical protein